MPELIIATTNPAKVKQIRGALKPLNIIIRGLDKNISLPEIKEDGETAEDNARQKAFAYTKFFGQGVLSMDNALYFKGLPPDQQPGVHVRRCGSNNDRCSDEEMTKYYASLVASIGPRITGYWRFAFCFAMPSGQTYETAIISPRVFVSQPSEKVIPGYPLESLQIDPESGHYLSEMTPEELDLFWQKTTGEPLATFVKTLPL